MPSVSSAMRSRKSASYPFISRSFSSIRERLSASKLDAASLPQTAELLQQRNSMKRLPTSLSPVSLTQRMIVQVAQDVRTWLDMGITLENVGINVTAADFYSGRLSRELEAVFGQANVPLDRVAIEITETVYLSNSDEVISREISRVRAQGICVVLDDLAPGYASLTHLLTVPVDMIKIDKSFIHGMEPQNASFAIVKGASDRERSWHSRRCRRCRATCAGCPIEQHRLRAGTRLSFRTAGRSPRNQRAVLQQAQRSASLRPSAPAARTTGSPPGVSAIDTRDHMLSGTK